MKLLAALEPSVFLAVLDDVGGQTWADTADIRQQLLAGGVELHADSVDATLHSLVEALAEFFLVYVVLVLPHTDAFRVDFH